MCIRPNRDQETKWIWNSSEMIVEFSMYVASFIKIVPATEDHIGSPQPSACSTVKKRYCQGSTVIDYICGLQ